MSNELFYPGNEVKFSKILYLSSLLHLHQVWATRVTTTCNSHKMFGINPILNHIHYLVCFRLPDIGGYARIASSAWFSRKRGAWNLEMWEKASISHTTLVYEIWRFTHTDIRLLTHAHLSTHTRTLNAYTVVTPSSILSNVDITFDLIIKFPRNLSVTKR